MTSSSAGPAVHVIRDGPALHELAAEIVCERLSAAITRAGRATIALSGGTTPEGLYRRLADPRWRGRVDWSRVDVFWGDERHVPPDDPASNYRMAKAALLDAVAVPGTRVLRVPSELVDPARAAGEYEAELRATTNVPAGVPRLDVILLGLGEDGHCASLFPGTTALRERERLVVANWVEKLATWRITFTYPLLDAARTIVFLAEGPKKAAAVAAALGGPQAPSARSLDQPSVPGTVSPGGPLAPNAASVNPSPVPGTGSAPNAASVNPEPVPAARVRPVDGELIWLLDEAAAQKLPR